mmetsp:Transcript_31812/g.87576  ORF Transcript_31812/g.87576 Transcript_31812/m.87576 type:complete len:229 (-) Transcript_31812:524-1210(-)
MAAEKRASHASVGVGITTLQNHHPHGPLEAELRAVPQCPEAAAQALQGVTNTPGLVQLELLQSLGLNVTAPVGEGLLAGCQKECVADSCFHHLLDACIRIGCNFLQKASNNAGNYCTRGPATWVRMCGRTEGRGVFTNGIQVPEERNASHGSSHDSAVRGNFAATLLPNGRGSTSRGHHEVRMLHDRLRVLAKPCSSLVAEAREPVLSPMLHIRGEYLGVSLAAGFQQ